MNVFFVKHKILINFFVKSSYIKNVPSIKIFENYKELPNSEILKLLQLQNVQNKLHKYLKVYIMKMVRYNERFEAIPNLLKYYKRKYEYIFKGIKY